MSVFTTPTGPWVASMYRTAAFTGGSSGVLTTLPWDTKAAASTGFDLSSGDVLLDRDGIITGQLIITVSSSLLMTGLRALVRYDPGGPTQRIVKDLSMPALALSSGDTGIAVAFSLVGAAGKLLRTEYATLGVGSRPLTIAQETTSLGLIWIG